MGMSGTRSFPGVDISGTRSLLRGGYVQRVGTQPPPDMGPQKGYDRQAVVCMLLECFLVVPVKHT